MKSLSQLLSNAPLLICDASSSKIQVGYYQQPDSKGVFVTSNEESGIGLFTCIEQLNCNIREVKTFVYANTPGSILGIRTVAMALRVWKTLSTSETYSYNALALLAEAKANPEVTYIADARRDSWHTYKHGGIAAKVATPDLKAPLLIPEGFRSWSPLPSEVATTPYVIEELWPRASKIPLLTPSENPDAFLYEQPSYATWEPQIHQKS